MHEKTLLRHLRRARDLTLDQLAIHVGIDDSTLSRIERRLIKPTEPQGNALAGYFGRPIDDLLAPVPAEAVA